MIRMSSKQYITGMYKLCEWLWKLDVAWNDSLNFGNFFLFLKLHKNFEFKYQNEMYMNQFSINFYQACITHKEYIANIWR